MATGMIMLSITLLAVALVYVLYCVNPNNHNALARVRSFILHTIPAKLQIVCDRVFGPRFSNSFKWLINYLFFSNNPVVMICYLFIGPGCYIIYVVEVMIPYFEDIYLSSLVAGNCVAWIAFYMYYKTYSTNPGIVTRENCEKYVSTYASFYDGYFNVENQVCSTCQVIKFAK